MADVGEACCTELRLGLGYHCSSTNKKPMKDHDHDVIDDGSKRRDDSSMVSLGLSFTVSSEEDEEKEEQDQAVVTALAPKNPKICGGNAVITSNCDGDNLDVGCRKKLRLSKDQSALLEETFKQHRTLTPAKKRALADQLDLKPRQVEIWFQNRRARSKLKQIELDFEQLKKEHDGLNDKNRRLEKELHDLRSERSSSASAQPAPDSNPAASLICSSCQKTMAVAERN